MPHGPREERVIYRKRFQTLHFGFRGKIVFSRFDACDSAPWSMSGFHKLVDDIPKGNCISSLSRATHPLDLLLSRCNASPWSAILKGAALGRRDRLHRLQCRTRMVCGLFVTGFLKFIDSPLQILNCAFSMRLGPIVVQMQNHSVRSNPLFSSNRIGNNLFQE